MPKRPSHFDPEQFCEAVLSVVRLIPPGEVRSYAEVALAAGHPGYARQVARIMSHNYRPDVPCHRVIHSNGKLGDYNRGGELAKRKILQSEGYPGR